MKTLRPNRTLYILFGFGALLIFLGGAAVWHTLIDGNFLDCRFEGVLCLFIPDTSDWYIHVISYALMSPLLLALILGFNMWRKQWQRLHALTRNLAVLALHDDKLDAVAAKLDLKGKVNVLDSNDCLCFCACLAVPQIYISRAVLAKLGTNELEALLLHEKYHLKNHDPLRILLGKLTVSGLIFMPVFKDLFERYLMRKEVAADQFAVGFQGHRRGIIGALQKLLEMQSRPESAGLTVSGTEALKYRIHYVTGHPEREKIPLSHLALSLILPALLILGIVASLTILAT